MHAAWEASVLPLNYAFDGAEISGAAAGRPGGGIVRSPHLGEPRGLEGFAPPVTPLQRCRDRASARLCR